MSSFLLKIVACITMFIDHIGYVIFKGNFSFMNYIGRIAFPIFAYNISNGYIHTKDLKKYFLRLFCFAIVSQIPFALFHGLISTRYGLNIFFTLLLGLACITIYDKMNNKLIALLICTELAIISEISHCDYGFWGVAIILLFYIFKDNKLYMSLSFILATIIKYVIRILIYGYSNTYAYLCICTILPIILINLYNKKQGKKMKYFFYIFYPVHLLLILLLWNIIYA